MSWMDVSTFALGVAPACRFLSRLVNSDSFEGWLTEIRRLHRDSPWAAKRGMDGIVASNGDLVAKRFRTYLASLDREYAARGWKLIPLEARPPRAAALPPFFDCRADTRVYACKACGSCVAPVEFTVGRGIMGWQRKAFILQPDATMPFCCGLHGGREMILSSGKYVLLDLACPNGACDACLGWKYQDCVPMDDYVPPENLRKLGQYWVFAEALKVVTPTGSLPTCAGEHFYLANDFLI